MERISELLDDYGWAPDDEKRRIALMRWMTETTNRILELQYRDDRNMERIGELEDKLIDAGLLQEWRQ